MDFTSSDDEQPLAAFTTHNKAEKSFNSTDISDFDDSLVDPDYYPSCEIGSCKNVMLNACKECDILVCEEHSNYSCSDGHEKDTLKISKTLAIIKNISKQNVVTDPNERNTSEIRNQEASCEVGVCKAEVFAACPLCLRYLCYDHLINSDCANDHEFDQHVIAPQETMKSKNKKPKKTLDKSDKPRTSNVIDKNLVPEDFEVEGNRREDNTLNPNQLKKQKINIKKVAKEKRNKGEEYTSYSTKKVIPARNQLKERCNSEICKKFAHECYEITDSERQHILEDYYGILNLQMKREFIARYVKKIETKRKTSSKEISRRKFTLKYCLPKGNTEKSVCKKLFLNTLSITERNVRTAVEKKKCTGVLEGEKRGGRSESLKINDLKVREAIKAHINRFPRMESHYCRASSTKEYLHPELSIQKMHFMFLEEYKSQGITCSRTTYIDVFKNLNLGFYHLKKDQCSLCVVYRTGDEKKKSELYEKYQKHNKEKESVRSFKNQAKLFSDSKTVSASFDLQQVILLPVSNESQLFYHRRLANFNFTVYNLSSSDCNCYLWHEGLSRRGASEISTCLYLYLKELDERKVEEVFLFSDGCSGQNKNSGITTMLLHFVTTSKHVSKVFLNFFEPYHGQNEGDSAHSAINTALTVAGNIFVPSQIASIIRLARRKKPYNVYCLESKDFLDFMGKAKQLRVLSVREDDEGVNVHWPSMVQYLVLKQEPDKFYFKTSHLSDLYRSITLPRTSAGEDPRAKPRSLNSLPKKKPVLPKEKFEDLMSLCSGPTPIVRSEEHVLFYKSLPHA